MPSVDLQSCEPGLREAFLRGKRAAEQDHSGLILRVTCTHRSVSEQFALWQMGRAYQSRQWVIVDPAKVVTQCDGAATPSHHNRFPSRAIDFCVTWGGKVSWSEADYQLVGPYFEKEGLVWGGRWASFKDLPHVEVARAT